MDDVQRAKELLAKTRKAHLQVTRRLELDEALAYFERSVRRFTKPAEETAFNTLAKTAERAIGNPGPDFESHVGHLWSKMFGVLLRQDWFVVDRFNWYAENPHLFADAQLHAILTSQGRQAIERNDLETLRATVHEMDVSRIGTPSADDFLAQANIVRG
jgi:molecular chaperone DnaK